MGVCLGLGYEIFVIREPASGFVPGVAVGPLVGVPVGDLVGVPVGVVVGPELGLMLAWEYLDALVETLDGV